jgi:hypothetical protein
MNSNTSEWILLLFNRRGHILDGNNRYLCTCSRESTLLAEGIQSRGRNVIRTHLLCIPVARDDASDDALADAAQHPSCGSSFRMAWADMSVLTAPSRNSTHSPCKCRATRQRCGQYRIMVSLRQCSHPGLESYDDGTPHVESWCERRLTALDTLSFLTLSKKASSLFVEDFSIDGSGQCLELKHEGLDHSPFVVGKPCNTHE